MTYVYVMKCADTDLVKIGIAGNPQKRLRQVIGSSGLGITLEYAEKYELAADIERNAHRMMSDFRRAGEWFKAHQDQAIDAVRKAASVVHGRDWIVLLPKKPRDQQKPRR